MANMPGIVIRVTSQVADAVSGLNKVNRAMGRTGSTAARFSTAAKTAFLGIAAAAGTAAIAVGVDAVRAFNEEEDALATFHKTLDNLNMSDRAKELDGWIDNLQYSANVADTELRPAYESLLRATGDAEESQTGLTLALDISAAKHLDLATVVAGLSKAYSGNRASLGRMNLGLDKATLKTASMSEITAQLARDFGGQSDTSANTLTGAMHGVSIAWDELQESLGQGLMGGGNGEQAVQNLKDMEQTLRNMQPMAQGLGETIAGEAQGFLHGATQFKTAFDALNSWDFAQAWDAINADTPQQLAAVQAELDGTARAADAAAAAMDGYVTSLKIMAAEHNATVLKNLNYTGGGDEPTDWAAIDERLRGARSQQAWREMDAANAARRRRIQKRKQARADAIAEARAKKQAEKKAATRTAAKTYGYSSPC